MLDAYVAAPSHLKGRRGKHQTSLILLLTAELKKVTSMREYRQLGLCDKNRLNNMRSIANDRGHLNKLAHDVCGKRNVFAAST